MSGISSFAKEVIEKALGIEGVKKDNSVEYSISVTSTRPDDVVMTSSFKFKKPIKQSQIEKDIPEYLAILDKYLIAQNLGVVDAVLSKYGLSSEKMGSSSARGTLPIATADTADADVGIDSLSSIRTKSGRFISVTNFKGLLDMSMRSYMLKHMTSGGPQLHNRTGRFISSAHTYNVVVFRSGLAKIPTIRIIFTYMMYPYHTFDPEGPNSRGLASIDRNPRRIIGDAIHKAMDDLINTTQYNIEVMQL